MRNVTKEDRRMSVLAPLALSGCRVEAQAMTALYGRLAETAGRGWDLQVDAVVSISDVEDRVQRFRGQKNLENGTPSGSRLRLELDYDNGRLFLRFNCVSCLILGPIVCGSVLHLSNTVSLGLGLSHNFTRRILSLSTIHRYENLSFL